MKSKQDSPKKKEKTKSKKKTKKIKEVEKKEIKKEDVFEKDKKINKIEVKEEAQYEMNSLSLSSLEYQTWSDIPSSVIIRDKMNSDEVSITYYPKNNRIEIATYAKNKIEKANLSFKELVKAFNNIIKEN